MSKKVAINCWVLRNKQYDGIGYFTINAFSKLIQQHPHIHFQMLCPSNFTESFFNFPNASIHKIFPSRRHPILYILYMEFFIPYYLKKIGSNLLISAEGFLSLRSSCKQVPIIHDINFEHYPEDVTLKNRLYYKFFFKRFAKKASTIATISNFSRDDISKTYQINPTKIEIVYCGINPIFKPINQVTADEIRQKYTNNCPYFVFVGSMHPRKNILRLIEAFCLFKKTYKSNIKLVLVGAILWKSSKLKGIYDNSIYKNEIIFTGRLPDEELSHVFGSALALCFVPTFEGFGMPIVEAFASEVPVICSNITSMPEVAGNAALLVNPFKTSEIANAMKKVVSDSLVRETLITLGRTRALAFSWNHTAKKIGSVMNRLIS